MLALLNSRLVDWIFRRGAADHANDYFAANKQFIAGLPIRVPSGSDAAELNRLGSRLHELARAAADERGAFLGWLAGTMGGSRAELLRRREIAGYDGVEAGAVVSALGRMRGRLAGDPRERSTRELIEREHRASVERLLPVLAELASLEREADDRVYELYELPAAMRALVEGEYAY